jgi:hypothetical protein
MSESEQLLRDDLDCLRLASDLTRLASYVPCAALKAHILQIARTCTSLVDVHQPGRRAPAWSIGWRRSIRPRLGPLRACISLGFSRAAPWCRPEPRLTAASGMRQTAP